MTITATTQVISLTATNHFPIKLTSSNFSVWKCQVHSALVGLGLEGYVDGTLTAPEKYLDTAKTQLNPCYAIWYRQDRTIISALIGSCSDTIQPLISSATTAKSAWDKLILTYANTSRGRIISLKSSIARTKRGNRSITDYLTERYAIAEDLALAQNPISDEDLVVHILNGLGPEYSNIISAIRVRDTAFPLTQLQDLLLEKEKGIQEAANATQLIVPTAHATNMMSPTPERHPTPHYERRGAHGRRGRGGHFGHSPRPSTSNVICRFCSIPGHEVQKCRKLQRFLRENHIYTPMPSSQPVVNTTSANSFAAGQPWLFDSGASHHVTSAATSLPSYTEYGGPDEVPLGDGSDHGGATHARNES
ncbi:unnamed protein product [Cuscuta epithymum]|uniref:Retrotransposon Copia-like N-terminal domain-containing protein n=1 Tax=Cuscuta epithymum TaxID=186058 RepID=A0AAV0CR88_9ASTE|nr:unnamed protein product [Cuscuta epithymum]